MKNAVQFLIAGALLLPTTSSATKYAGDFMSLGGGARAMGMGGAFAAVADDASSVFWNPAGISGFQKRQALFMHSERFSQLENYNFASYVMPFNAFSSSAREGALGFALIHQGADGIVITNGLNYEELNGVPGFQPNDGDELAYDLNSLPQESYNDFAFLGSFAIKTVHGRIGGSLKILYADAVAGYSSMGIGLDIGFLRENIIPHLNMGMKIQDATGTYLSWSTGTNEFIIPSVKLGTAYTIDSEALNGSLILAIDGDFYFENRKYASDFWIGRMSADLHLGSELILQDKVMIRGGLDAGNAAAGAGLRWNFVGVDYAYLHHKDDLEASHRISILAEF